MHACEINLCMKVEVDKKKELQDILKHELHAV